MKLEDLFESERTIRVRGVEIALRSPDIGDTLEPQRLHFRRIADLDIDAKPEDRVELDRSYGKLCAEAVRLTVVHDPPLTLEQATALVQRSGGVLAPLTSTAMELAGFQVPIGAEEDPKDGDPLDS